MVAPISATSLRRLSFVETPCSIFRWAIERNSARRESSVSYGRSRPPSWNTTIWPFPRAFAVIIATSAQATSSRGLAACSGPDAMPTERLTGPTGANSASPICSWTRSVSRNASARPLVGAMIANSSPPIRHTQSDVRTAPSSTRATSESTWSPVAWL